MTEITFKFEADDIPSGYCWLVEIDAKCLAGCAGSRDRGEAPEPSEVELSGFRVMEYGEFDSPNRIVGGGDLSLNARFIKLFNENEKLRERIEEQAIQEAFGE